LPLPDIERLVVARIDIEIDVVPEAVRHLGRDSQIVTSVRAIHHFTFAEPLPSSRHGDVTSLYNWWESATLVESRLR
jgi:hypothetical protein